MDGEEADPAVELEAGDLVDQAAPGGEGRCYYEWNLLNSFK